MLKASSRRDALLARFPDERLDAFLVTALPNIRYLSGFTGSNAAMLISRSRTTLYTDPRYTIQSAGQCDCSVKTVKGDLPLAVAKEIVRRRYRRVGIEKSRITFATWTALREALPRSVELIACDGWPEQLRRIKSAGEIDAVRKSVLLNSRAFDQALKRFQPGATELELAAEVDYQMRRLGASGPAFETIVASGPRTALPHAEPTSNPITPNQLLLIDMGAFLEGYASDMTRTMFVGRVKNELRSMYRAVLEAQLASIDAVRPGIPAAAVDRAARKVLAGYGLAREFTHSTGHGLGLEIHESPRLGKRDKTKLEAGMTITIEPGVYRAGLGGIRIEDTVLVTATGCEVLTPTPKELLYL